MFFNKFFRQKQINDTRSLQSLQKKIERKEKIERAMVDIAIKFRSPELLDTAINESLKILVDLSGSDRAYVLQLRNETSQYMSHEYCKIKLFSAMSKCQNLPYSKQPWMIEQYFKYGHVAILDVDKMPLEAEELQKLFKSIHMGSMLSASFASNYQYKGALCITNRKPVEEWDSELRQLIQLIATLIEHTIERKNAEDSLIAAKQKAEENDNLKSAFLMNLSHEVRTPLNSIIGFSYLLSKGVLNDDKRNQLTALISANSNRLLNVIDNLMDIARIESNTLLIDLTTIEIENLIAKVIDQYESKIPQNVAFNTIIDANLSGIKFKSDFHRLSQMIGNLIDNAIKFTTDGEIFLRCKIENNELKISVTDTGIGIAHEHFDKIFTRFWQVDMSMSRRYGGNGLGLAICKELSQIMGYNISLHSALGAGSQFCISIPLNDDIETRLNTINKNALDRKKVLVMDDFEVIHNYIKHILEPSGYACTFVSNAAHAMQLLQDNIFDAIILDVKFNSYTGLQVYEFMIKGKYNTPSIAQSMSFNIAERQIYIDAGFFDYLEKPLSPEKILKSLQKIFN